MSCLNNSASVYRFQGCLQQRDSIASWIDARSKSLLDVVVRLHQDVEIHDTLRRICRGFRLTSTDSFLDPTDDTKRAWVRSLLCHSVILEDTGILDVNQETDVVVLRSIEIVCCDRATQDLKIW